jgi:hypothetical protein
MTVRSIAKTLSANDTGDTGGHQAGMLIPKDPRILGFFPPLNPRERNPRCHLIFQDESGDRWEFAFIYYNNQIFGGTRNEYRLTRMTRFIRENSLVTGDEIVLERPQEDQWKISIRRARPFSADADRFVLKLGAGWKIVDITDRT